MVRAPRVCSSNPTPLAGPCFIYLPLALEGAAAPRRSLMWQHALGMDVTRHNVQSVGDSRRGPASLQRVLVPDIASSLNHSVWTLGNLLSKAGNPMLTSGPAGAPFRNNPPSPVSDFMARQRNSLKLSNSCRSHRGTAGYHTATIGKYHVGASPHAHGFDVNIAGTTKGGPATYFSPYQNAALPNGPRGEYLTDRLTNEAVRHLEGRIGKGPFFLYLAYFTIHMPYQGRTDLVTRALGRGVPSGSLAHHAAMVECMDESVGKILKRIDTLGLRDDTVVFLASDNGGLRPASNNDPLRGEKGSLTEGGVRIPFAVRWPHHTLPGSTISAPVSLLDVMPTLVDLLGLPPPPSQPMDGQSLLEVLEGGSLRNTHRPVFQHFNCYINTWQYVDKLSPHPDAFRQTPAASVRKGPWKLLLYFETMVRRPIAGILLSLLMAMCIARVSTAFLPTRLLPAHLPVGLNSLTKRNPKTPKPPSHIPRPFPCLHAIDGLG